MGFVFPRLRRGRASGAPVVEILEPYTRPLAFQRRRRLVLTLLGIFAFFYGAFFSLTTTYLLEQMAVPLVILALLVIWLLPETGKAPDRLMEWLFFAFPVALLFWPNYLALTIPGLPWISALRLVAFPLTVTLLIGLSQSVSFRIEMKTILDTAPYIWKALVAFIIIALLSCFYSNSPGSSMSKLLVFLINYSLIFFASCYVLSKPGRMERLCYIVLAAAIFVSLIALQEARQSSVPWAGHIPSFLKIDDPLIQQMLAGSARSGGGAYRVQSIFTHALTLAEFLVYALPVILFIATYDKRIFVRIIASASILLSAYVIYKTDARLGKIGVVIAIVLYGALFSFSKWKNNKQSVIAPLAMVGVASGGVCVLIASFIFGRVRTFIWGTGLQSYSTAARYDQLDMAIPKILSRPWGYGLGQGGGELGYTVSSGFQSIDSYFLAMVLDVGVIGFVLYFSIFFYAIIFSLKLLISAKSITKDLMLLGVCGIVLFSFVVIKVVLTQSDNHPYVFMILGAIVALPYRILKERKPAEDPSPELHSAFPRKIGRF